MTSKQRFAGGKGGEKKPVEGRENPFSGRFLHDFPGPGERGGAAPPPSLMPLPETLGIGHRQHARAKELMQSIGLAEGQELTAEKMRALIAKARQMDGGAERAAAVIMTFSVLNAPLDGRVETALREVQKDAGLPEEIDRAIRISLDFIAKDRAIEGK